MDVSLVGSLFVRASWVWFGFSLWGLGGLLRLNLRLVVVSGLSRRFGSSPARLLRRDKLLVGGGFLTLYLMMMMLLTVGVKVASGEGGRLEEVALVTC